MDLKMKLDKKSLIQIVILIVLVAGGAGAYLMQQDGGLDFISGLFESEPATIRAPARRAPAPAPDPKTPTPGSPECPRHARRGTGSLQTVCRREQSYRERRARPAVGQGRNRRSRGEG